ncbi:MAG TPA: hypothetical protein PKX38_00875 [Alphaproteobacteria bacterium]|nr:hypothetical protein [Micavibrio sp.]MBK9562570.1 hypothetical protein [Micavibrio sp.]HQX26469.1 hypothetical protein [Alphaproteobacteria bacterium]
MGVLLYMYAVIARNEVTKQSRKNWIAAPTMSAHDDEGYDVVEKRRKNGL